MLPVPPIYLPRVACPFNSALFKRAFWAASTFSTPQIFMYTAWRALPFNSTEASSSDCPPEKNTVPGIAGHTALDSVLRVNLATSSLDDLIFDSNPDVIMFGFSKMPSSITFFNDVVTIRQTFRFYNRYKPVFWQIIEYLANEWAVSLIERSQPSLMTVFHFANLHPLI